jgi:hypothetical protein
MGRILGICLVALLLRQTAAAAAATIQSHEIQVEFLEGPMGIQLVDTETPEGVKLNVEMVVEGSAADSQGVLAGDLVVAVNGDYNAILANSSPSAFADYVGTLPRPVTLTFAVPVQSKKKDDPKAAVQAAASDVRGEPAAEKEAVDHGEEAQGSDPAAKKGAVEVKTVKGTFTHNHTFYYTQLSFTHTLLTTNQQTAFTHTLLTTNQQTAFTHTETGIEHPETRQTEQRAAISAYEQRACAQDLLSPLLNTPNASKQAHIPSRSVTTVSHRLSPPVSQLP